MSVLKIANLDDPARPLTVEHLPDGTLELRLGDMGITDVFIRLDPIDATLLADYITE